MLYAKNFGKLVALKGHSLQKLAGQWILSATFLPEQAYCRGLHPSRNFFYLCEAHSRYFASCRAQRGEGLEEFTKKSSPLLIYSRGLMLFALSLVSKPGPF